MNVMTKKAKFTTRELVLVGMMTALLAVLSQISIPMPSGVPITMQTFAVALTGFVLSEKLATVSLLVYLLLGAVGVPVFSNFTGGFARLTGLTGGFLLGFLPMAFFCGLKSRFKKIKGLGIVLGTLGLLFCHIIGTTQFALLSHHSIWNSALLVSIPYLLKDFLSVLAAYFISLGIRKAIRL